MSELRQVALREKAYELHYQLMQHYSSQIFRARIAITTATLIVVAYALDVENENKVGASILGFEKRPIIALFGATLIVFLCLMELGYLKRFYEVVRAAQDLEEGEALPITYAARYKHGEAASMLVVYGIGVLLLLVVFIVGTLSNHHAVWQRILTLILLLLLPAGGVLLVFRKLRTVSEALQRSNDANPSKSTST